MFAFHISTLELTFDAPFHSLANTDTTSGYIVLMNAKPCGGSDYFLVKLAATENPYSIIAAMCPCATRIEIERVENIDALDASIRILLRDPDCPPVLRGMTQGQWDNMMLRLQEMEHIVMSTSKMRDDASRYLDS